MILCIPYSPTLPRGYDKLVGAISRNGKHPAHTLFVISESAHDDAAFQLAMKLRDYFGRYFAITVPSQPESMVMTSNRMFIAATEALKNYAPAAHEMQEPVMLYFDPTWRPTKPRWLDEFQTEYYIRGAPTTFGNFRKDKVVGPLAIKRDFIGKSSLLRFLSGKAHWREFLAWELINNGVQAEALGRILPAYIRPFDP